MRKALSPRVRGSRPPRHVQHSQLEWPSLKDRSGAGGGRAPPALLVPTARPSTSRLLNPRRKLASRQPADVRTPEHLVPREGVGAAAGCQPRCDARVPPFLPSLGKKQPSGPWGHWLETEKVRYAWEPPGGHSGAGGPPRTAPSPGRVSAPPASLRGRTARVSGGRTPGWTRLLALPRKRPAGTSPVPQPPHTPAGHPALCGCDSLQTRWKRGGDGEGGKARKKNPEKNV